MARSRPVSKPGSKQRLPAFRPVGPDRRPVSRREKEKERRRRSRPARARRPGRRASARGGEGGGAYARYAHPEQVEGDGAVRGRPAATKSSRWSSVGCGWCRGRTRWLRGFPVRFLARGGRGGCGGAEGCVGSLRGSSKRRQIDGDGGVSAVVATGRLGALDPENTGGTGRGEECGERGVLCVVLDHQGSAAGRHGSGEVAPVRPELCSSVATVGGRKGILQNGPWLD